MAKRPRPLILPDASIARIAKLREQTQAASDGEVVRRALRFYESLLKEKGDLPARKKSK
ncbi:MAG: ribbon-helix-helix protein, CopG family [bacterium]|nr:ribbon-helix-helix protein, CopG family [bacterium]